MATTKDDVLRIVNELIESVESQTEAANEKSVAAAEVVTAMQAQQIADAAHSDAQSTVKAKLSELVTAAENLSDENPET